MKVIKNNVSKCRKLLHCKGKNTNYLKEFKYMRGVVHNLNMECLRPQSNIFQINLIAKEFVKKMLSNYIYFDGLTININDLVNELFNISDRYYSLEKRQIIQYNILDVDYNNNLNREI